MRTTRGRAIALGALATVAAVAAPAVAEGATKSVLVADDYFAPVDVKVKVDDKVNFKWAAENSNPHNATLEKGPNGIKKKDFKSATGSIGIRFKPKFEKKGTYDFVCTIHPTVMTMKVTVKK